MFGTFGTDDVGTIGYETTSNKTSFTTGANETVMMPMAILKRNETCTTNTGDWFRARYTTFGEQFTKAFGTIWFLVTAGETLTSQNDVAIGASEAFTMPRFVLVRYTA